MAVKSFPTSGYDDLLQCIEKFSSGKWRFIQLRGVPLGAECIDCGDVDLLGNRASLDLLLAEVYKWVQQGKCHCRVRTRRADKVELLLFSHDGLHSIRFDIWLRLRQFDHGSSYVEFESFLPVLSGKENPIVRLPAELEAAVYIQHLVCKKQGRVNHSAEIRLQFYRDSLGENASTFRLVDTILKEKIVSNEADVASFHLVCESVKPVRNNPIIKYLLKFTIRLKEFFLAGPRKVKLVSIMGCDGVGKTSLAMKLIETSDEVGTVFKGKHLYRKSYLHKLAVIFIRPLLFQSREVFDERFAPLVYLRACLGLQIKLFRRAKKGLILIDRSIIDFLYLNRKTDKPGFSRFKFLSCFFGVRIPTVHCVVSYENITKRKLEMSKTAIEQYNLEMFEFFTGRIPTDYVIYNNDTSLEESAVFLKRILYTIIHRGKSLQGGNSTNTVLSAE